VVSLEHDWLVKCEPHIDDLCALAVLPVCPFHAAVPRFLGCFVSVDLFL
jgi:hypothetical protein